MPNTFIIEIHDSATLTVGEIWPNGDAPEDPTVEDVIEVIKKQNRFSFVSDWGFEIGILVNGREVPWS